MKIAVAGAAGRMGQMLIREIVGSNGSTFAGGTEAPGSAMLGKDAGEVAGVGGLQSKIGSDPAASWWYSDTANSPWNCATSSQEGTCAPISGTPMSDDAAIAAAKDLLEGLGLAADEARWSVADASWFGTGPDNNPIPFRHVSAEVVLQDMPTGMTWTADLAPDEERAGVVRPEQLAAFDIHSPQVPVQMAKIGDALVNCDRTFNAAAAGFFTFTDAKGHLPKLFAQPGPS